VKKEKNRWCGEELELWLVIGCDLVLVLVGRLGRRL